MRSPKKRIGTSQDETGRDRFNVKVRNVSRAVNKRSMNMNDKLMASTHQSTIETGSSTIPEVNVKFNRSRGGARRMNQTHKSPPISVNRAKGGNQVMYRGS